MFLINKKGFTLIEIIVCIALIAIIGTSSFFGIRLINNKIKINKLEQITDKAIEAAQVYLETNIETKNQLYNNGNGVSIPLKLLYNKGLLNIDNTDLTINDLEDEYVVTFLGGSGGTENCEQITSSASWANDKPIYLCMKSDGSSNLAIINPNEMSNLNKINIEAYYFKGAYPHNYARYKKGSNYYDMRILSVDTDDSIIVVKNDFCRTGSISTGYTYTCKFSDIFAANEVFNLNSDSGSCEKEINNVCSGTQDSYAMRCHSSNYKYQGGYFMTDDLYIKTVMCPSDNGIYYNYRRPSWLNEYELYLHLKPCIKITGGTGAEDNPYILEKKGTC